jgi:hypothetical protein
MAEGYTPNGLLEVTRGGRRIGQVQADASGAFSGHLTLPRLGVGQRRLTYVATDVTDPSLTASVSLLTTATHVGVRPIGGVAERRRTITARGFFGGRTLWAHVVRVREGRPPAVRTLRIGPVRGACRTVTARKRLFRRGATLGGYRVQFDTFRRYRPNRAIKFDRLFTIQRP